METKLNNLLNDATKEIEIAENLEQIEEIRLRTNLPIIIKSLNTEKVLNHIVSVDEINQILQKICNTNDIWNCSFNARRYWQYVYS